MWLLVTILVSLAIDNEWKDQSLANDLFGGKEETNSTVKLKVCTLGIEGIAALFLDYLKSKATYFES